MFVKGAAVEVTDIIQDLSSYDNLNGDEATQNIMSTKRHESNKNLQSFTDKSTVKLFSCCIWSYKEGWGPHAFFKQIQHDSGWYNYNEKWHLKLTGEFITNVFCFSYIISIRQYPV